MKLKKHTLLKLLLGSTFQMCLAPSAAERLHVSVTVRICHPWRSALTLLPPSIFTVRLTSINLAIHPNENSVPATIKLQERKVGKERTETLNNPTLSAFSGKGELASRQIPENSFNEWGLHSGLPPHLFQALASSMDWISSLVKENHACSGPHSTPVIADPETPLAWYPGEDSIYLITANGWLTNGTLTDVTYCHTDAFRAVELCINGHVHRSCLEKHAYAAVLSRGRAPRVSDISLNSSYLLSSAQERENSAFLNKSLRFYMHLLLGR